MPTRAALGLLAPLPAFAFAFAFAFACACSSDQPPATLEARLPAQPGPLTGAIPATDTVTLAPLKPRRVPADPRRSSDPASLTEYFQEGYAEYETGPGDPHVARTLDGAPAPVPGPNRKRVARFVHISDFQLADDEAPARLCNFDSPGATAGAFRASEGYGCRMLNATVRTINKVHADGPLDFVVLGGDNIDNAQQNELDWVLGILNGGEVRCDSGDIDDPVKGPDNDGKDPFMSDGLAMPWYWVMGNHDILAQGNLAVNDTKIMESIGTLSSGGTRDYKQPGAPLVRGDVIADARRIMLRRSELVKRVAEAPGRAGAKGHGLDAYAAKAGRAYYTFDVPDSPVRFVAIDTSAETGGAEGIVRRGDLDEFIKPELARGVADKKWLVLVSHHALDKVSDETEFGGSPQKDAISNKEWSDVLTTSPNIILDLVGHAHGHRIRKLGKLPASQGIWEVQTGAVADFGNQFRVMEIWDEDNGQITIRATDVDFATEGDRVAETARKLSVLDWTAGWSCCGNGTPEDRNVILWAKKP